MPLPPPPALALISTGWLNAVGLRCQQLRATGLHRGSQVPSGTPAFHQADAAFQPSPQWPEAGGPMNTNPLQLGGGKIRVLTQNPPGTPRLVASATSMIFQQVNLSFGTALSHYPRHRQPRVWRQRRVGVHVQFDG
jgi:hypothetical protein